MPSRNIIRSDGNDCYYHVYGRGGSRGVIFATAEDKDYFLHLVARHLSVKPVVNRQGYAYPHYRGDIELLTYCLMDNHFHLLFYQVKQGSMTLLMRSIMTAYSAYFNHKYDRSGPLLESRFKSSLINREAYLLHVSRYIHLNPRSWKRFAYSSITFIAGAQEPEWLQTGRLLDLHESRTEYMTFVADYEDNKRVLDDLYHELAGR